MTTIATENRAGEANQIGSPLYHARFLQADLSPKEKALLPLRQLGAFFDDRGILQLAPDSDYAFSRDLAPHDTFWVDYATCVRKAFPEGLSQDFSNPEERRMIHQFRMYIDRCNLEYVRRHYGAASAQPAPGNIDAPDRADTYSADDLGDAAGVDAIPGMASSAGTDLVALLAYEKDLLRQGKKSLYYKEPSRYHNKLFLGESFRRQLNDKIETANRHGEFILSRVTGMFVTQWNVFTTGEDGLIRLPENPSVEQQREILNSESFNYATGRMHYLFDVLPAAASKKHSLDYPYKQKLKAGGTWRNISKTAYRETIDQGHYQVRG